MTKSWGDEFLTNLEEIAADQVELLHRQHDAVATMPLTASVTQLHADDELPPSWLPVDLGPVLDGTLEPLLPTVGRRVDGVGLFYPGKIHSVVSETEAGKTWFALAGCLDEMHSGHNVLYIDFEDDVAGVVGRLITMGATTSMISEHFSYVRPAETLGGRLPAMAVQLAQLDPSLIVLDGVTEAMVLHGMDPLGLVDTAKFRALLTSFVTTGAAVVALDHVTKSTEGRGRYAIGSVHKLNGIDGAQYLLESRRPHAIGLRGVASIKVGKDRPAQLRKHGLPSSGGLYWFGDLVVDSRTPIVEVSIEPPHERSDDFRPTVLMQRISDALAKHGPLSQTKIRAVVGGQAQAASKALTLLVLDGYVSEGDSKHPHQLIKPYAPPESESSDQ